MSIKNVNYAGKVLNSGFGELKFDAEGFLTEPKDLTEDTVKELVKLKGFEKVEKAPEKPKEDKKEDKVAEPTKEPEKKVEEPAKEEKPAKKKKADKE